MGATGTRSLVREAVYQAYRIWPFAGKPAPTDPRHARIHSFFFCLHPYRSVLTTEFFSIYKGHLILKAMSKEAPIKMTQFKHYRIDYLLNGKFKSFYISAEFMDSTEAWHHASVDAGIGRIPKYRLEKVPRVSKPYAEHFGITDVEWVQS